MIKRMPKSNVTKGRVLWNSCSGTIKDNSLAPNCTPSVTAKPFSLDRAEHEGAQDIDVHLSTGGQIAKLPEGLYLLNSLLNSIVTRSLSFIWKFKVLQ